MLPTASSGGPHNLGDPDDRTLRKVEKDILIPTKLRDRTKAEKCVPEVEAFTKCCKASGFWMIYKCRAENKILQNCLRQWYENKEFQEECTEEYLNERSEYRRTGLTKSQKKKQSTMF